MFGLKKTYFWPTIATNLSKTTTLQTNNIIQQDRKIVKVKYVSLVARPLKKDFFAASLNETEILKYFIH